MRLLIFIKENMLDGITHENYKCFIMFFTKIWLFDIIRKTCKLSNFLLKETKDIQIRSLCKKIYLHFKE